MRKVVPGAALALLTSLAVGGAAAQAQDLSEDETLAVQRTMAGNWAWGAERSLEDQRVLQEEALPMLEATMAQQTALLEALQAQLALAEREQRQVQAQAAQPPGPAGGIPAWGAALAGLAGAAVGAAGMRFHGHRGKPPEKPA